MGRHSIPGPGDTPPEPFPVIQPEPPPSYEPPEPFDPFEPMDEEDFESHDSLPPEPLPPADDTPTARFADGSWQGGHRSTEGKRRGVSVSVVVVLVLVVAIVGGIILWRFFGNVLSSRSDAAAATCSGTQVAVGVVADPSIAPKIAELAERYNKTAGPIGDSCVKLGVKAANSDDVIKAFVTNDWPIDLGQKSALWIPASSISVARLQASAGAKIVSDSRSLVSSPVVLAIKPQLKPALADKNWGNVPALQTNPVALDAMNMPGWGSLRLALPTGGDSDATYLAAEAVAAASAPPNTPATAGISAVNMLIGAQPKLANADLSTAMDALLATGDPAVAPVHAVVITEQQLYQRTLKLQDAKTLIGSWLPSGPTALADFPMASLAGDWLSEEQITAASEFKKFLQKPEQLADLAKIGFRAGDSPLPTSEVAGFSKLSNPVSIGDPSTRVAVADAVLVPTGGTAVTIMLDQSMPNQDGGNSRLANVVAALKNKLQALPPSAAIGLWTFDGVEGRSEVATGPLSDQVNGQPRSVLLSAALDKQFSSNGGAVSFTTLKMIYDGAVAGYLPGLKNSILVITGGPHTDRSLDGPGLVDAIRKSVNPARPVAVNVIDFGSDPDRAAWAAVAQATGGGYQNLATSDTPDLGTAVTTFLG